LRRLIGRGVDTVLIASENDPGVTYVDHHFGTGMRALSSMTGFRRIDLHGTDHTFTSLFAQEKLLDTLSRHFQERHL
jgi:hypothetical protein